MYCICIRASEILAQPCHKPTRRCLEAYVLKVPFSGDSPHGCFSCVRNRVDYDPAYLNLPPRHVHFAMQLNIVAPLKYVLTLFWCLCGILSAGLPVPFARFISGRLLHRYTILHRTSCCGVNVGFGIDDCRSGRRSLQYNPATRRFFRINKYAEHILP